MSTDDPLTPERVREIAKDVTRHFEFKRFRGRTEQSAEIGEGHDATTVFLLMTDKDDLPPDVEALIAQVAQTDDLTAARHQARADITPEIDSSRERLEKQLESRRAHERRVAAFPTDVREAHRHAIRHRDEILASDRVGCFCCVSVFRPSEIVEWLKEQDGSQTALCPRCGIDSIIGDRSGYPITREFLSEMERHWFSVAE